jgi:hypothetical protein
MHLRKLYPSALADVGQNAVHGEMAEIFRPFPTAKVTRWLQVETQGHRRSRFASMSRLCFWKRCEELHMKQVKVFKQNDIPVATTDVADICRPIQKASQNKGDGPSLPKSSVPTRPILASTQHSLPDETHSSDYCPCYHFSSDDLCALSAP